MLYSLFNEYSIAYIKIAKDHQTKESNGYAFVGFKNHSKAEEAIAKLNFSKLVNKTLQISWFNNELKNYKQHAEYNIFVKKIDKKVTHQEFHDHFTQFGNILSAKLKEDEDGETLGYGFVLYDSAEAAKKAIEKCNGEEWKGKKIFVGQFIKGRPKKPVKYNNVYVRNIPKNWTNEQIKKYFEKYGKISSMIIKEPNEANLSQNLPPEKKEMIKNHKYGFVCFESLDGPALNAVNQVPYFKIDDKEYNEKIENLVKVISKESKTLGVKEGDFYKFACYLDDNNASDEVLKNSSKLKEHFEAFSKLMIEYDGVYLIKDKTNRLDCCQALKKAERAKQMKKLYESIKKKIKEKYKFCNLYVKNLPDSLTDDDLIKLFSKFGSIKSAKVCKKEFISNYLGVKRSEKIFAYVCFYERAHAQEAKKEMNQKQIVPNGGKLYVDYHQNKKERQEFLKLKLVRDSEKRGNMMYRGNPNLPVMNPEMIRRFPPQSMPNMQPNMMPGMMPPGMMMQPGMMMPNQPRQMVGNQRNDYFGEQLFSKISQNKKFQEYTGLFTKIVGIFLDCEDKTIEKMIKDDSYFEAQVYEALKLIQSTKPNNSE
jgi:polyadenylate-binding protein